MFSGVYPYVKIYQRVHFCPTLNICSLCRLHLNKAVKMLVGKKKDWKVSKLLCSKYFSYKAKQCKPRGFLGGAVVENPPANAGDTGSSPGLGRSHMPRSNWAHEPQLLSLRVWSLCSATREAVIVRGPRTAMKSGPRLPQLEKPSHSNKDPTQPKIKKKLKKKRM